MPNWTTCAADHPARDRGSRLKRTDEMLSRSALPTSKRTGRLRDQFNAMKAQWENEKNAIGKVQKLREEIEQRATPKSKAERRYDLKRPPS